MKTIISNENAYKLEFNSITEMGNYCANLPERSAKAGTLSTADRRYEWDLGHSFETALNTCKQGGAWPEGAEKLQAVNLGTFNASDYIPEVSIDLAVTGGGVDTGEFLAGSPECFLQVVEEEVGRKIITVDFLAVCAGRIDAAHWLNYGRAVLALVDTLEAQNYSVQLRAVYLGGTSATNDIEYSTVIKHAGAPWSAATVAYPMTHPAFFRRVCFRLSESAPHDHATRATYDGSYGSYEHMRTWTGGAGADIYFGYQTESALFNTPEKAIKHVMAIANDQQPNLIKGAK